VELAGLIIFISLGVVVLVTGFIGCIVPVLPGPIIAYLALIFINIPKEWKAVRPLVLIVVGIATLIATVLDYVLPAVMSKKKGASKAGVWGSVIGMIAGMFLLPPYGILIGAFVGAVAGELIFNKEIRQKGERKKAFRAGWGVFLGTLFGIIIKFGVTGIIAFYFIRGAIRPV
jgi:hypothetical protein